MKSHRPTVADLLSMKGKRQLTMLRVETLDEAEAAEAAGIDLVSVPPTLLGPEFREVAPTCFAFPGLEYGDYVTAEEYMRAAFKALKAGGDAVYCAAGLSTVRRMREEGIPVCGHVGLIPPRPPGPAAFAPSARPRRLHSRSGGRSRRLKRPEPSRRKSRLFLEMLQVQLVPEPRC